MRAITYSKTGKPDVLTLTDRPRAEPGHGEVRVRIHRSGVNPTDWKSRTGGGAGTPVDPPQVPNQDGSGVIEAIGPGVDESLLGSSVRTFVRIDCGLYSLLCSQGRSRRRSSATRRRSSDAVRTAEGPVVVTLRRQDSTVPTCEPGLLIDDVPHGEALGARF